MNEWDGESSWDHLEVNNYKKISKKKYFLQFVLQLVLNAKN